MNRSNKSQSAITSYHNTTSEGGESLRTYRQIARGQDREVLDFFATRKTNPSTPSEVHDALYAGQRGNTPLTSVRRAITNLTNAGLLKKTNLKKRGVYGRPEGCWILAEQTQLRLL